MRIQAVLACLCVSIFFCLMGCSSSIRVAGDDLIEVRDKNLSKIVRPARISGVVLALSDSIVAGTIGNVTTWRASEDTTYDIVLFDADCGVLDDVNRSVTGVTTDGDTVSYAFDDLHHIQMEKTDIGKWFARPQDVVTSKRRVMRDSMTTIDTRLEDYWDVVSFGKPGATIDNSGTIVNGVSRRGTAVSSATCDVAYAEYREFNVYKTIRISASLGVLAVFILGIAGM